MFHVLLFSLIVPFLQGYHSLPPYYTLQGYFTLPV